MDTFGDEMEQKAEQKQSAHVEVIEKPVDAYEAARILNCTVNHVRNMARQRKIPAFQLGISWRFRPSSLRRWMDEQEQLNYKGA